ncbi:MAG: hypothetical protein ACLQU1_07170, partial [Bryobacteraceae bacterium]
MPRKIAIYVHPENGYMADANNRWYLCGTPAEIFQAITLFDLQLDADRIGRAGLALDFAHGEFLRALAAVPVRFARSFEPGSRPRASAPRPPPRPPPRPAPRAPR